MIDGIKLGKEIREEVRSEVGELSRQGIQPGLAAVLVGNNPASQVYVKSKIKACENLGIYSRRNLLAGRYIDRGIIKNSSGTESELQDRRNLGPIASPQANR